MTENNQKQYTRCPDCGSQRAYYIYVEDWEGGGTAIECPDCHGSGPFDDD
jgi:DNA-directed RNA polymerase subunit RPC12/RpoP